MHNDNAQYTIVRHNFGDTFGQNIRLRGYNCCALYKGQEYLLIRSIRRLWRKLHLPFYSIWYDKKVLKYNGKIVVFEPLCSTKYLQWLRKKKPNSDIVFWYWNIAKNSISPNDVKDSWCRKWSFSRLDCKKYNMKFNPLPYFREITIEPQEKQYDIVFVGKDKGRLQALIDIRNKLHSMGLTTKFVITPTRRYKKNPEYSPNIEYIESVKISAQGRAVLDYIEVNNSGQSLRVIQALFMKEKIITNSIMVSDYDFYCPENIFILGKDDLNRLPEFLNIPYRPVDNDIVNRYDFDQSIRRFFDETDTFFDNIIKLVEKK